MRLGELRPTPGSRRASTRKGQGPGSGKGKTAGRGHKGQRARSGARRGRRTGFEGGQMPLHRRLPKTGFSNRRFRVEYQIVNVGAIQGADLSGEVGPAELARAGLIRKSSERVKILGDGELTNQLALQAHAASRAAREKIESAGGSFEVLAGEVG